MEKRIQLVVPDEWTVLLDSWRREQPDIPSRSEAIRVLVERAIKQEQGKRASFRTMLQSEEARAAVSAAITNALCDEIAADEWGMAGAALSAIEQLLD